MTTMTSQTGAGVRDELLRAAVGLLDEDGPDALQARKVAGTAKTSTMAVYTHFGGMRQLIAAVAEEGMRAFTAALTVAPTDDPVADLLATGTAYRRYAIEHPHMYRLMFGSTSAHGINAPAHNMLTLTVAEIGDHFPSFGHLVHGVHRSMRAGRIAGSPDDDAAVLTVAVQFWTVMHGFVMLELAGYFGDFSTGAAAGPILVPVTRNLLIALGDAPERVERSLRSVIDRSV